MPSEMDSNQFENLYSSALFHKLSFHSSFLQLFVVLRDLQTLTLAHIYKNLHSASFVQSLFSKTQLCSETETRLWCGRS